VAYREPLLFQVGWRSLPYHRSKYSAHAAAGGGNDFEPLARRLLRRAARLNCLRTAHCELAAAPIRANQLVRRPILYRDTTIDIQDIGGFALRVIPAGLTITRGL
jgi:hypothetical protein